MTHFSYQLYSSRNHPPLANTLKMLAETGYDEVEAYGALMADEAGVAELEKGLAQNGLTMPTAHLSLELIEENAAHAIQLAKRLGLKRLYVPYLPPQDRPSDAAGWRAFGQRVAEAGKPIIDAGLTYGWHNHDFEFIALSSGEKPIELIMAAGDHITLELDLAWVFVAADDPMHWLNVYQSRVTAAHLKDVAPKGEKADEDGWADLGDGVMDWASLFAKLKELGVPSLIVEHDNPSDHVRFASRSLAAARALDAN